jgi:hypothetical protein
MPQSFDPWLDILPRAQKEDLESYFTGSAAAFVLYGGTAITLHLGHRQSLDVRFR